MISSLMYPISWLLSLSCDSFDMRPTSQARYDLATKLSHRCYNVLLAVNITTPVLPWRVFSDLNSVRKLYVRESYAVWGCSGYGLFYIQAHSEMLEVACLFGWYETNWLHYRKTSNISHTLVGNKIVDNSDVVGASPVGAAPTTSSFST